MGDGIPMKIKNEKMRRSNFLFSRMPVILEKAERVLRAAVIVATAMKLLLEVLHRM